MFFSKWQVHFPSSGLVHVSIARILTPAAWHMVLIMVPHFLVLLRASNYYWMCVASLYIQYAPLHKWLVLTFFFRDKAEDHATPPESLWTLVSK